MFGVARWSAPQQSGRAAAELLLAQGVSPGQGEEKPTSPCRDDTVLTHSLSSPWFKWLIFGKAGSAAGYATFRCTWQRTRRYLCYDLVADHSRTRAAKVSSEQAGQSGFSALAACPHPATAASKCCPVRVGGSAAGRRSRSSARSYVPLTRHVAAVNPCRTRCVPAADSRKRPAVPPPCLASYAAPWAASPVCSCTPRNFSPAAGLRRCDTPYR